MKEELLKNEQLYDGYYLVAPGSDYGRVMWKDIDCLDNAEVLPQVVTGSNKFLELLHHIHFSFAINRYIQLPFQSLWKKKYALSHVQFQENKKYCVIFTDVSAGRTDCRYLKSLSEEKNITLVLILVNTMQRRKEILKNRFRFFSMVFSFDKGDCEKYGFIFHPTNYSRIEIKEDNVDNDAFYVGVSKGRLDTIKKIYDIITKNGGKADFFVSGVKRSEKKKDGIQYNRWLSYSDVLSHIAKTNCIVEVMEGKQSGVTMRMMEAVCYNKRLLTNNQSVKESPFYQTGYISVFQTPGDIDVDFVKDRSKVDYKYHDEFSSIHLIDHINELRREK